MIIKFNGGFLGGPDMLKSVVFCCDEMNIEVMSYNEIKIDRAGLIGLRGRGIKFCPHCGKKIESIRLMTDAEVEYRKQEVYEEKEK